MVKKQSRPGGKAKAPTRKKTGPVQARRAAKGRGSPDGAATESPPSAKGRTKDRPEQGSPLTIVGIGASAGGLEALEHFFHEVPPQRFIAFVVVTHQHPGHTGLLRSLIRKHTPMRVLDVVDGMPVEPNTVYLSPAGKNLSLLHGILYALDVGPNESVRLPIDFFFRSLAQDQKHRAIGVVLSGAGTDGTLGLRAIKGEAGIAIVQDPQEAEYPGMPRSAIAAKVADLVLPVAEMPERILGHIADPGKLAREAATDTEANQTLPKIFAVLRDRTGNDFSIYKPKTIMRRIERRMNVHEIGTLKEYLRFLHEDPHETDALFQELLIGVTSFFRDHEAFAVLWRKGIAPMLKDKPEGYGLRLWVPGCSTGEEAYSLAITLREYLGARKKRTTAQIFATDLDKHAIEVARAGFYAAGIANDVTPHRLQQFFLKDGPGYRVKKDIRNMVIFAVHNLLADPPFTKMDVISCRNLLIYLEPKAQRQLLLFLHYALKPGGILLLGGSETVSAYDDLFACIDRKWKLFLRREVDRSVYIPEHLPSRIREQQYGALKAGGPMAGHAQPKGSDVIESMLLDRYVPASVIVNERGEIIFIHGRTGAYLEPAPGPPNRQLVEMARQGLRSYLASALLQVSQRRADSLQQNLPIGSNGSEIVVRVAVRRLSEPESLRGLILVTFEQLTEPAAEGRPKSKTKGAGKKPLESGLMKELQYTKHRLQQSIEEMETSNEEFKATNEELQSTNEELQSTNEELETAKEELQSLNEELVTLNSELQGKVDELSNANDDLQNLLNSTEVGTIFLDPDLRIRRFTSEAMQVVPLIPSDVGRPLSDIVTNLNYGTLIQDIKDVLLTLTRKELEVQTKNGDWYFLRILPYRTAQNVIDGAVLAFVNITLQKQAEQLERAARHYADSIVETVREPLLILDAGLRVVSANSAFCEMFRVASTNVEGKPIHRLPNGMLDLPRLRELLEQPLPEGHGLEGFEVDHVFPAIGRKRLRITARRLQQGPDRPVRFMVAFQDRTDSGPAEAGPLPSS